MKVASPILIAALASTASAAISKDKTRTNKKQSIFHKVDDLDAKKQAPLLDGIKTARNAKKDRRQKREGGDHIFEKATKVNREGLAKERLSSRRIKKKKAEGDAAAAEKTPADQEATNTEQSLAGEEKKPTAEAASGPLRKPEDAAEAAFDFDKWEGEAAPSAVATDTDEQLSPEQKVMQQRRRDRVADLVRKKERKASSSNPDGKKGRRVAATSEPRKSNPRPGRRATTNKDKTRKKRDLRPDQHSPRPGYDKRDLKKSKKSSNSSSGSSSSSSGHEYDCEVRVTNLTKEQWFSDIFWMVHSDKVELPLFEYGRPAFDDLAILAQDGDPDDLIDFYRDNDDGVLDVWYERGPLRNGESIVFGIPKSGSYDLLTMATSFIFSNDGFVALDAVDIEDDAEFYLWGIDAGVEANTQLCWTVQASCDDFPPNAECFYVDEEVCDENDNSFPGEGFVYVHNGIHNFRERDALEDFLAFTCDDLNADSFVEYFSELGFDDDFLLYDDDQRRNERDDQSFLDAVEDIGYLENLIIFEIALDANDFDTFCDDLEDIRDELKGDFETLEPQIFDFRTPMVWVEIEC